MSQSEKVRARLELLDERLARLRAEKERLLARAGKAERRRDARRKIVIGGTVLAAIEHEGVPPIRTRTELVRWLDAHLSRPHDRVVFDLTPRKIGLTLGPRQLVVARHGRSGIAPPPVAGGRDAAREKQSLI